MGLNYGALTLERDKMIADGRALDKLAVDEKRTLTGEEQEKWDKCFTRVDEIDAECKRAKRIEQAEADAIVVENRKLGGGDIPLSGNGLSGGFGTTDPTAGGRGIQYRDERSGKLIRSLGPKESVRALMGGGGDPYAAQVALGESIARSFEGTALAEKIRTEVRALSGTSDISGGFLRPTTIAANIIDSVRARSVAIAAGVSTLAMPTADMRIARWEGSPTAEWLAENAVATEAALLLGAATLRARTLRVHIPISEELLADSTGILSSIEAEISAALALKLDRAILHGGDDGDGESPVGLRITSGVAVIAAVGIPGFDDFSNAVELIETANAPADAALSAIMHPRTAGTLDRLKSGDGQPLKPPASWDRLKKLSTTSVSITEGGGSDESYVIVGPFGEAVVGVRLDASMMVVQVPNLKYQREIIGVLRADFVAPRPEFFVQMTGITV